MKILIGTQNKGKIREYAELFRDISAIEFLGLNDMGLGNFDVEETGTTFGENARIKALAYARASGLIAVADDSGLVVDALDGRPGIYSSRYAGPGASDEDRRQKLLDELRDIPDEKRTARFVCVIAIANPQTGAVQLMEGIAEGHILHEERDQGHGFGYDPVFRPLGYDMSFGELNPNIKNAISHRGIAAQKLQPILRELVK